MRVTVQTIQKEIKNPMSTPQPIPICKQEQKSEDGSGEVTENESFISRISKLKVEV